MAQLLYLVKNAKTSQYWCISDAVDINNVWKLKKKVPYERNMLSTAKQQQSYLSYLFVTLFTELLSTPKVAQNLSHESKTLSGCQSTENLGAGNNWADERMHWSKVLKNRAWGQKPALASTPARNHTVEVRRGFKLDEALLFLTFVIKSLWFQLGKQRCLANMLLPAFWQAKPFTTTRLPLLHSSICFYIKSSLTP